MANITPIFDVACGDRRVHVGVTASGCISVSLYDVDDPDEGGRILHETGYNVFDPCHVDAIVEAFKRAGEVATPLWLEVQEQERCRRAKEGVTP